MLEYDVLFFQFRKYLHWYKVVVYVRNRNITYSDSMTESSSRLKMCDYVCDFVNDPHTSIRTSEWLIITMSEMIIPKQNDGHTCVVFMLAYMERILRARENFDQLLNKHSIKQYRMFILVPRHYSSVITAQRLYRSRLYRSRHYRSEPLPLKSLLLQIINS